MLRFKAELYNLLFFSFLVSSIHGFEVGDFKIGGTLRTNYVNGDYVKTNGGAPQRGGNGGNFSLDVFRINVDYERDDFKTKLEYRWYDGVNFFHTAQVDWSKGKGTLTAGLNRVPFGIGAYGPANSWFFDQHFYVGLADDMDLGIKYNREMLGLDVDLGYYIQSEWNGAGATGDSARYAYDVVSESSEYKLYEEKHQFNLRVRKKIEGAVTFEPGVSLQFGTLEGESGLAEDSYATAFSFHSKNTYKKWTLLVQATTYDYDADYNDAANTAAGFQSDDDLIGLGAYDFAWPVASQGEIYSLALSYTFKPKVDWMDTLTIYNDYSIIVKSGDLAGVAFNDSELNVFGIAIVNDGWYISIDQAFSNGNYFVGNEGDDYTTNQVGDFGVNGNDKWKSRLNINIGYYF